MTTPAPAKKNGLGEWVSSHQKAVVGILIVVGVIFFILISKGKSTASSANSNTSPTNGTQYTYNGGGEYGGGYANSAEYGQLEQQLSNISTGLSTIAKPPPPASPPSDNHHHHQIPSGDNWPSHHSGWNDNGGHGH